MPIVRALADGLAGDRVMCIDAMLNGTANAVLSRMEATLLPDRRGDCRRLCARLRGSRSVGRSRRCRRGGEAVDSVRAGVRGARRPIPGGNAYGGGDSCRKTSGRRISAGARSARSRTPSTTRSGGPCGRGSRRESSRRRRCSRGRQARENVAVITGAYAGDVTLTGAGAGGDAIAAAALGDLVSIARDRAAIVPAPVLTDVKTVSGLADQKVAGIADIRNPKDHGRPCERAHRTAVSSVQDDIPGRRHLRLRSMPRSARAGLRLRGDHADARADRTPPEEPLALPRAAAHHRRAEDRVPFRIHAARPVHAPGRAPRRPASSTSRTTR